MIRSILVLGLAASALTLVGEREARACGGCFQPPTQTTTDINDERMLLAVSTTQTTLYDQIQYTGNPASFAWVLPIHGTVDVGLSADVLFDSIDALTATQIVSPPYPCAPSPCAGALAGGGSSSGSSSGGGGADAPVTVTKSENVGPYATVQLHSTDASALNNWLAQNGFSIPAAVTPVLDAYVTEGFDFLAMKLLPNQGIQSMRPVRVTTPGASVSLPLRMAAIGTGATVGITIWIVSEGRYEPQNFPFFHIEDSALVWDWSTSLSNYTTLRAQNEAALGGKGWEIESSLDLNQTLITNVIFGGGIYYANGGIGGTGPTSDAGEDYLPVDAPDGGDGGLTADEVRAADVADLFVGIAVPNVRVTRIRSDISHAAMTTDFVVQASADQSELSNIRNVTQSVNANCPVYSEDSCGGYGYGASGSGGGGDDAGSGSSGGNGATSASGDGLGGRGCIASPESSGGSDARLGMLAGIAGLVVLRAVRSRKRAPKG